MPTLALVPVALLALLFAGLSAATWFEPTFAWPLAMSLYGLAFGFYGWAVYHNGRRDWRPSMALVLGAALVFRLALLGSQPHFSDDIWRYVWDGHVQFEGINPYLYPPADAALTSIRNATWSLVNHPEVPTIYPPSAQIFFVLARLFDFLPGGQVTALRLLMIAAEGVTLLGVWRLSQWRFPSDSPEQYKHRRIREALWLLWNPLMIVEFAGSGHLDMLAIAPLVGALALVAPRLRSRGKFQDKKEQDENVQGPLDSLSDREYSAPRGWKVWMGAGALVGLSTAAKLLGLLALPILVLWAWNPHSVTPKDPRRDPSLVRSRRTRRVGALLAGLTVALVLTSVPYMTTLFFEKPGTFARGLATYASKWRSNDGGFTAIVEAEALILSTAPGAERSRDRPHWRFDQFAEVFRRLGRTHMHEGKEVASTTLTRDNLELTLAKFLVALALGFLLLFLLAQRPDPSQFVLVLMAGLLLLAPTAHPWYIAWLVPLAVVHRSGSMMLWSGLVVLSYATAVRYAFAGVWKDHTWVLVVEYVPVWGLALYGAWKGIFTPLPPAVNKASLGASSTTSDLAK